MNTYKNYIDLLRNILKNFDNNEFNDVIKKILSKIFDDYYMNRDNYVWCIYNLYKQGLEPYSSFFRLYLVKL